MPKNYRSILIEGLVSHWLSDLSAHPDKLRTLLLTGHKGLTRLFTPELMAKAHAEHLTHDPAIAEALIRLAITPDTRVVRWRTRWSSGPSDWDSNFMYFSVDASNALIDDAVRDRGDQEGDWSEHYRGVDWEDISATVYHRAAYPEGSV